MFDTTKTRSSNYYLVRHIVRVFLALIPIIVIFEVACAMVKP